jgi:hypothetical protein
MTLSFSASAQLLKAQPFKDLLNEVKASTFTYQETGKVFGYVTTQSCLFTSANMIILKNYCFPVGDYPARSFTMISKDFGKIDLYQEDYTDLLKRDIRISSFAYVLELHLPPTFPKISMKGLNDMLAEVYYEYYPGCWSTNYSPYVDTNEANCSVAVEHVEDYDAWAAETQKIVLNETEWKQLMETIEKKLVR